VFEVEWEGVSGSVACWRCYEVVCKEEVLVGESG